MSGRLLAWEVVLVLAVVAAVVYLDWWRRGELELLNRRVDELELARQPKPRAKKKPPEVTL